MTSWERVEKLFFIEWAAADPMHAVSSISQRNLDNAGDIREHDSESLAGALQKIHALPNIHLQL